MTDNFSMVPTTDVLTCNTQMWIQKSLTDFRRANQLLSFFYAEPTKLNRQEFDMKF